MSDLDKLEQLARAATPGPWKWRDEYGSVSLDRDVPDRERRIIGDHVLFAAPCGYENSSVIVEDADAAYIAAVSPDVVLGLIARLRQAERERDGARAALTEVCATLRAHVEADRIIEPIARLEAWERVAAGARDEGPRP